MDSIYRYIHSKTATASSTDRNGGCQIDSNLATMVQTVHIGQPDRTIEEYRMRLNDRTETFILRLYITEHGVSRNLSSYGVQFSLPETS
jgi:hypothetical protein